MDSSKSNQKTIADKIEGTWINNILEDIKPIKSEISSKSCLSYSYVTAL